MRLRSLAAGAIALAATTVALAGVPASAAADPAAKIGPGLNTPGQHRVVIELNTSSASADAAKTEVKAEALSGGEDIVKPPTQVADRTNFLVATETYDNLVKIAESANVVGIRKDKLNSPSLVRSIPIIGADKAHAAGVDGTGSSVAILDTGIDEDHPFLAGRIADEACFSAIDDEGTESLCPSGAPFQIGLGSANAETDKCMKNVQPADKFGICDHGTHVAGIAAGKKADDKLPANGVAPGAKIVAVQVFTRFNRTDYCGGAASTPCVLAYDSSILTGMAYVSAVAEKYRVAAVNLSLGGGKYDTYCDEGDGADFKKAVDKLLGQNVATVVAAGNEGFDASVSWPACVSGVVTVGSTDVAYKAPTWETFTDDVSSFSNRGVMLDLFAPGWPIFSSVPTNAYAGFGGTSMAAPHVTGAFAVMAQKTNGGKVPTVLAALKRTGKPITYASAGKQVTTPRLDLASFFAAQPTPTATPTSSASPTPSAAPNDPTKSLPIAEVESGDTVKSTGGPSGDDNPAPATCKRGSGKNSLNAAKWAAQVKSGKAATIKCYLSIVDKGSKVFSEVTGANTAAKAYKVLKGKNALDRELLAAWLNYAHGVYNTSSKVHGSTTFAKAVATAEKYRSGGTAAQVKKATAFLAAYVNK
ncbi:S8 family peptidase [Nonomuraea sp. NPDC050556]|uniref:S8 family peptidase n=1 Tax=Nonomuraea sp. NPDC050556 TaxID=3364369 RepID=UPI0037A2D92D